MGSVEDFRKAAQDFLAPEMRTLTANIEALTKEQGLTRQDIGSVRQEIGASEGRTRSEMLAMETRLIAAIRNSEQLLSLKIDNALLQEYNAKLQRKLDEYQKPYPGESSAL